MLRARRVLAAAAARPAQLASRRHVPAPSLLPRQLRWRSALAGEPRDRLARAMDELAACRDSGNWRAALKLLDQVDKEGFALDADMYELAMAACARMGKIEVLPGLLQNMEVDALRPTHRTVDFVMQAYIAAEEWKLIVELAKDVTAKGVPLSEAAFQAAFEACGKMRDATSARQILLNVEATNSLPLGTAHYAAAIRACGMGGRPDLATGLFAHMEEKIGLSADGEVFNQLIRAQIVNGALDQALQTFSTVSDRADVDLPESIYAATIDTLVHDGEFWQASQLFTQMMEKELSPSVFCYGRMMVAFVRLNKHDLARECWQRILAAKDESPSLHKYSKMAVQLSHTNGSELAVEVFEHIFPHHDAAYIRDTTYAAAIRSYGRLGRTQTAVDLFDTFVASRKRVGRPLPRSAGLYLAVFNALSRDTERDPQENSRDAKRIWDIMVDSLPVVLAPAYASLAGVLASSGDLTTLQELMEHAEESLKRRSANKSHGHDAIDAATAFDDAFDDADSEYGVRNARGPSKSSAWLDELLFNGVISGFSKARSDQSERVMDYLSTMRARGLKITDSVVRASTDAFVKHEQWPLMFELMDFIDPHELQNAEVCFGDTISKLLEAQAWEPARFWITRAHRLGMQPPIRGKMETLRALQESGSREWQIAYALARETLSFKQMVQENVDSVADAIEVCVNAGRADLVIKMFEHAASHPSVVHRGLKLPLRSYKQTLLACMREHSTTPDFRDGTETPIDKAEAICAQMLQTYPARNSGEDALDSDALSLAISIKATMGDDDDVLALFEKMQQHRFTPNSYAFNAAIMAYSRAKNLDRVLAVRDELCAHHEEILHEPKVTQSLLFSIAILHDDKLLREHLASTRAMLPHATTDAVMNAFLHANRLDKCVEYFDETVTLDVFHAVLRRILDGRKNPQLEVDIALSAQLLLKYIAFHGLDTVKPRGVTLHVARQLVAAGKMREALAILNLFNDPKSELPLADLKPEFQQDVLEMLLYIHGEERQFDNLYNLFDKAKPSAVPLNVRHYQLAMEFCLKDSELPGASSKKLTKKQRELQEQGATTCLKLFESLRMQFVKPNGPVYLHAMQSCYKLGRLDVTGARVLGDAVDQGFSFLLSSELFRLANVAIQERREPEKDPSAPVRRGRKPAKVFKVDVKQLAELALFGHHHGVPVSWKLGKKLLELRDALPTDAANEIEYIVSAAEAAYVPKVPKSAPASETVSRATRAAIPARKAPSPTNKRPATGKAGARWGELYLQKLSSDE